MCSEKIEKKIEKIAWDVSEKIIYSEERSDNTLLSFVIFYGFLSMGLAVGIFYGFIGAGIGGAIIGGMICMAVASFVYKILSSLLVSFVFIIPYLFLFILAVSIIAALWGVGKP